MKVGQADLSTPSIDAINGPTTRPIAAAISTSRVATTTDANTFSERSSSADAQTAAAPSTSAQLPGGNTAIGPCQISNSPGSICTGNSQGDGNSLSAEAKAGIGIALAVFSLFFAILTLCA
jgi:hypothetical protein